MPRGRCLGRSIDDGDLLGLGLLLPSSRPRPSLCLRPSLRRRSSAGSKTIESNGRRKKLEPIGPGDRLAAVGPGGVVGADVGELLERNGRLVHRDLGCLAAELRQGQQVELVGDAGQRPSSVGAEQDLVGGLGLDRANRRSCR